MSTPTTKRKTPGDSVVTSSASSSVAAASSSSLSSMSKRIWSCGVCHVALFDVYETAIAHETTCIGASTTAASLAVFKKMSETTSALTASATKKPKTELKAEALAKAKARHNGEEEEGEQVAPLALFVVKEQYPFLFHQYLSLSDSETSSNTNIDDATGLRTTINSVDFTEPLSTAEDDAKLPMTANSDANKFCIFLWKSLCACKRESHSDCARHQYFILFAAYTDISGSSTFGDIDKFMHILGWTCAIVNHGIRSLMECYDPELIKTLFMNVAALWKRVFEVIPVEGGMGVSAELRAFAIHIGEIMQQLLCEYKMCFKGKFDGITLSFNFIRGWSDEEHAQFEEGIIRYGWGNWKHFESFIPTRNNNQIKNHADSFKKNHPSEFERLVSIHKENAVRSLSMTNSTVLTSRSSASLSSGGGNGNTNVVPLAGITVWNNNNEEKDKKESLLSVHQQRKDAQNF